MQGGGGGGRGGDCLSSLLDTVPLLSPFARTVEVLSLGILPKYFSSSLFVSLYNLAQVICFHVLVNRHCHFIKTANLYIFPRFGNGYGCYLFLIIQLCLFFGCVVVV